MPKPQVGQVVTLTWDDGTTLPYRVEEVWHDGALLVTPLKPDSGTETGQTAVINGPLPVSQAARRSTS